MSRIAALLLTSAALLVAVSPAAAGAHAVPDAQPVVVDDGFGWGDPSGSDSTHQPPL